MKNGFVENLEQRGVDQLPLLNGESITPVGRVDLGQVQNLGSVKITDARNGFLVE